MTVQYVFTCLLILFVLGGIAIGAVARKQEKKRRRKSWLKYLVYFVIVNLLFLTVLYGQKLFGAVCILIVLGGYYDIIQLQRGITHVKLPVFYLILTLYTAVCLPFCFFGFSEQSVILFTLFIVCAFDAFSQIFGQLFGKRKIFPRISPNKTDAGLAGGLAGALMVSAIIGKGMNWDISRSLALGLGIASFAFVGDLLASCTKRCYQTKDFSGLFPEHGGWLDRFDSLIFAGSFMWFMQKIC